MSTLARSASPQSHAEPATLSKPAGGAVPAPRIRRERTWAPRIWLGSNTPSLARMLSRNRYAFDWSHAHIVAGAAALSLVNTFYGGVQRVLRGRRIARTEVKAPLFILGHWRTGTTLLHELLIKDPRHTFPTNYECFCPHHFMETEEFATRWMRWLLPPKRPMDDMPVGWEHPQEDEFALCNLGLPSPYWQIAFPNHAGRWDDYYELQRVPSAEVERWRQTFRRFLQTVTAWRPGRMVLKSPPHTFRVPLLADMFPDARFIHIVRDPYVVYPSTINLWTQLYRSQGLQRPRYEDLQEQVFSTFTRMYDALDRGRTHVAENRFYELRYEDLIRDPLGRLREMYAHLELDDFAPAEPAVREHLAGTAGYRTNRYRELAPSLRDEITHRWGAVIRRYGYDPQAVSGAA